MKFNRMAWLSVFSVIFFLAAQPSGRAATTNIVRVSGPNSFVFSPTNLLISTGDSVRWTNVATMATHDVTPGVKVGNTTNAVNPYWAPRELAVAGTFQVAFSNVGFYPYMCGRHVFGVPTARPEQTGTVTVVQANLLPVVELTSPTNLLTLTAPASFLMSATASDGDGTVTNVEFFNGATLLGAVTAAPYEFAVTDLPAGWHQLTARATDNLGGASSSTVVNVLVNSNRTVNVSGLTFSPNLLSVTVGDTVTFNGLANFHTVTGSGTNEAFCGTAPVVSCQVTFNRVGNFPFHCNTGTHRSLGMTGLVSVIGPNLAPSVRLTAPADGATFITGAVFTVSAEASDLFGRVNTVRFERLSPNANLGVDSESPYSTNASLATPGTFRIQARATDNTGLVTVSAPISLNVVAPVDIQLLSPATSASGFKFDYTANPGLTYVVEGSAADGSPVPFVPIFTNQANTNRVTFTDPDSATRTNRVYRVLRQQ